MDSSYGRAGALAASMTRLQRPPQLQGSPMMQQSAADSRYGPPDPAGGPARGLPAPPQAAPAPLMGGQPVAGRLGLPDPTGGPARGLAPFLAPHGQNFAGLVNGKPNMGTADPQAIQSLLQQLTAKTQNPNESHLDELYQRFGANQGMRY